VSRITRFSRTCWHTLNSDIRHSSIIRERVSAWSSWPLHVAHNRHKRTNNVVVDSTVNACAAAAAAGVIRASVTAECFLRRLRLTFDVGSITSQYNGASLSPATNSGRRGAQPIYRVPQKMYLLRFCEVPQQFLGISKRNFTNLFNHSVRT